MPTQVETHRTVSFLLVANDHGDFRQEILVAASRAIAAFQDLHAQLDEGYSPNIFVTVDQTVVSIGLALSTSAEKCKRAEIRLAFLVVFYLPEDDQMMNGADAMCDEFANEMRELNGPRHAVFHTVTWLSGATEEDDE